MSKPPLTPERLARATAAALLCVAMAAAPLAAGGTRAGVKVLLAVPVLAALLLLAFERTLSPPEDRGMRLPWPLWPPLLLVVFYALQLVPISPELLDFLSPAAAARRADLPGAGGLAPLSLDPAATRIGLTLQAAFVAALIVAFTLRRPRQAWLLRTLVGTGALVALIGLAHWGLGAKTLYGIYPLRHLDHLTGFFGTFVNNNTLAGFEVLAGLVALGMLARTDSAGGRLASLAAAILCFMAALLAGSRGGHAALAVGVVLFGLCAHLRPGLEPWRKRARLVTWAAAALGGLGVAAALVILPEWSTDTLAHLDSDGKVAAWDAALAMARDFWLTGSGRDAFILVYPGWQTLTVAGAVSHPENQLLQLACEAGLPGLILGIGGGVAALLATLPGLVRRGSPTDWGMFAGLTACGLQQLVDFGFESAGLALPVAVVLGIALSRAARRREGTRRPPRRWVAPALAGCTTLALGLLAWQGPALPGQQSDAERPRLATATAEEQAAILAAHPADYLLPLALAQRAIDEQAPLPEVFGWLNRTFTRFPQSHRAHLLAARVLVAARRPAQAATEFRLAIERAPWLDIALAAEAVASLRSPSHLMAAVPANARGFTLLSRALTNAQRPADLRAITEEMELLAPDDPERRRVRGEACLTLGDGACAEAEAAWLLAHDRPTTAWQLRARGAAEQGDVEGALAALAALGPLAERSAEALLITARVHTRLGQPTEAYAALDLLAQRVAGDPVRRAEVHVLRARLQAKHGEPEAALASLIRADTLDPDPRTALAAIRQAVALGRSVEARRLLDAARRKWPRDDSLQRAEVPTGPPRGLNTLPN